MALVAECYRWKSCGDCVDEVLGRRRNHLNIDVGDRQLMSDRLATNSYVSYSYQCRAARRAEPSLILQRLHAMFEPPDTVCHREVLRCDEKRLSIDCDIAESRTTRR